MLADCFEDAVTDEQTTDLVGMSAVVVDEPIGSTFCRPNISDDTVKLACQTSYGVVVFKSELYAPFVNRRPALPAGHVVDRRKHDHGCTRFLHVADDVCHVCSKVLSWHAG